VTAAQTRGLALSPRSPDPGDEKRRLWQLTGMGMEFAGGALGMGAIGWLVDRQFQTQPWGIALGTMLGVTGAMYLLIRSALKAQKQALEHCLLYTSDAADESSSVHLGSRPPLPTHTAA